MSQNSVAGPQRGKTYFQGQPAPAAADYDKTAQIEGQSVIFSDTNETKEGASLQTKNSGREVHAVLVRNTSGAVIKGGEPCHWEDGKRGRRVDDTDAANGNTVAGYADHHYTSDIRIGDLFWLVVKGPTKVRGKITTGPATTYTVNDVIKASTAKTGGIATAENDGSPTIYSNGIVDATHTPVAGNDLVSVTLNIRF